MKYLVVNVFDRKGKEIEYIAIPLEDEVHRNIRLKAESILIGTCTTMTDKRSDAFQKYFKRERSE